jgi:ureidoacrylate peracid hydrolase
MANHARPRVESSGGGVMTDGVIGTPNRRNWRVADEVIDLHPERLTPHRVLLTAHPATVMLDVTRCALVVIDMQNDFCHPHGWLASIGVDVTPARAPIEPLLAGLPVVRSAGIPVIWLNWGNRPDRANLPPNVVHVYDPWATGVGIGSTQPTGHPVLQRHSWGAALVDELLAARHGDDLMIDKYRMSGFWDTELDSVLRQLEVSTVLFGGVNADQCVLATLMDAACAGYDVVMLEDITATTSPASCWEATLYNVRQCFGFTARLVDLTAVLDGDDH